MEMIGGSLAEFLFSNGLCCLLVVVAVVVRRHLFGSRESYLPQSFRKVVGNNPPPRILSPPMLRDSEATLDIGLYCNLCNYVSRYFFVCAR